MSPKVWTLPEIAKVAGVGYRTLHAWVEQGIVTPSLRGSNGSGCPAIYSDDDLITIVSLAAVRPLLSMDGTKLFAESLRESSGENHG